MKQIQVPCQSHGYVFIDGRLVECEIVKFEVCFAGEQVQNNIVVSHADWTMKIGESDFFLSVEDFRSNTVRKIISDSVYLRHYFRNVQFGDSSSDNFTWIIKDGRVKKHFIDFDIIEVFYGNGKIHHMSSPDIPEECWDSEESAIAHQSVEVVNADGSSRKIPSAVSLITLTDEQKEVVDKMVALSKEAEDLGIVFVADWNGVYAFNKKNVKNWELNYYGDTTEDERIDLQSDEFAVGIKIVMSSDENMLDIERKDD